MHVKNIAPICSNNGINIDEMDYLRTTVMIEDTLYQQALELADQSMDKSDLFREAIKTFIRVQYAKRLPALGGAVPEMQDISQSRTD